MVVKNGSNWQGDEHTVSVTLATSLIASTQPITTFSSLNHSFQPDGGSLAFKEMMLN